MLDPKIFGNRDSARPSRQDYTRISHDLHVRHRAPKVILVAPRGLALAAQLGRLIQSPDLYEGEDLRRVVAKALLSLMRSRSDNSCAARSRPISCASCERACSEIQHRESVAESPATSKLADDESSLGAAVDQAGVARADVKGQADWAFHAWREQLRASSTSPWKQAVYKVSRPAISLLARRKLSRAALQRWRPDWVSFGRGFPFEYRVSWGLDGIDMRKSVVLVQGAGTGWEIPFYARHRPARIIASDLCAFDTWDDVAQHCRQRFGVSVEFHQASLEEHGFLGDGSIDICVSHGVLEHCRDLSSVLRETRRLLRRGGRMLAAFGPLWHGAGGDHFCTRAGLENVYAHVTLDAQAYRAFYETHRRPSEDFQSGGRYVELDLFSKLTADQYFQQFAANGFMRTGVIVYLDRLAFRFERQFPERWTSLVTQLQGHADEDDLHLAGLVVRLDASTPPE